MEKNSLTYPEKIVVIGGSAGSLDVIFKILPKLTRNLTIAIIIVLHRRNAADSSLTDLLSTKTIIPLKEVEDKDQILAGNIYLAPPDYHLLLEKDFTFSLDDSEKINFSRPSLDVTFESVADVYRSASVGIILSGANDDGTKGLTIIEATGGIIMAQKPETAQMPFMPQSAINRLAIDLILAPQEIAAFINSLH